MSQTLSMTGFHSRIEADEIGDMLTELRQAGHLHSDKSVIVHDLGRMKRRLSHLQAAFPADTLHAIAIKANPLVEVLRECVSCGCGLEAASIEEVHLALAAGCPAEKIIFDSPAKTRTEISQALELGIHLNADNFDELSRIDDALQSRSSRSVVGLRVNPEVRSGAITTTNVGSIGSKFGVSIRSDRDTIIDAFQRYPWLIGLHVHIGSQGCGLDLLCEAAERIQMLRSEIRSGADRDVGIIDIGGGLPAVYRTSDAPPSPQEYADRLKRNVPGLMNDSCRLITEFGRAVQAGCGVALSQVEYARTIGDRTIAVIHLGADFLLRPVYRRHDWKHEFLIFDHSGALKTGPTAPTTIAGPLCFGGDILSGQIQLPHVEAGDWIAIRDCGAYTLSMWSRHCSRGIPAVVGYDDGNLLRLREQETPADVVRFWQ